MGEETHDFELSEGSESEHFMLEGFLNFLDGHEISRIVIIGCVLGGHDHSVGARAYGVDDVKLGGQLES